MASWALNGEKIFFVSNRDGDKEIYLMDTDGNNAVHVTINSFQDDEPDWHENIHGYSASKMISHKNIGDVNAIQVVVPPDSEKVGITGIGIRYELHGTHGDVWEYWIGLHDDGNYYVDMVSSMFSATASKGQRVDIKYIQKLAASFTDFYETERILRYEGMRFDGSVNFEVLVTLENGETFTMNTPPDYEKCCFIPWSIVYKNKEYMQSNGKITHAVLRLLNELDEDEEIQIVFDKWISWGCYPGDLYFAYCDDELSDDFPQSKDELTAVEELGKSHVQWEVDISGIVGPAAYGNGAIYIATTESVICINTKSRKKIWETPIEFDGNGKGTIVVDGEFVYAGIPPNIYKINGKTGGLVWKFTLDNTDRDSIQIIPVNDLLIVWDKTGWVEGKISCLAAENGDVIWEIPEEVGFLGVVNNAVLYKIEKNWKDYTYTYELVNITSGKKIWQKGSSRYVHWNSKIKNWSYYEGILYVCKEDEGTVVAVDMETMEESVVYSHRKFTSEFETGNLVQYCQVYEEGILLSIIEFGDIGWSISRWDTRIVFLDRNGNEIWEYRYDEKSVGSFYCVRKGFSFGFEYNPVEYAEIDQDTLFLVRENGFFEAFHIETGKKLWENEIRDSVNKVLISNHKIYAAAKDCKVYCLNMDGDIIWEVKACDNLCTVCVDSDPVRFYGDAHILCDCEHLIDAVWIGEEILLVTTENKLIGVS